MIIGYLPEFKKENCRCCDGTEFGTGFGCLQCDECDGLISSSNPRDEAADWSCGGCSKKRSGKECVAILDDLNTKLAELSKSADDNRASILDFEKVKPRKKSIQKYTLKKSLSPLTDIIQRGRMETTTCEFPAIP